MEINAQFRDDTLSPTDFETVLIRLGRIIDSMAEKNADLEKGRWCLKGDTREEAHLYPAYEGDAPSTAALAVLKEKFRKSPQRTFVAIWDGNEATRTGVSMSCHIAQGRLNSLAISMTDEHRLTDFDTITRLIARVVQEFNPAYAEVSPADYFNKRVFDDKPGVGWMLYLPTVVTVQQAPETRALIPVPEAGRQQTGTIIVSVTDAVFSVDNPEHVEIANRIEVRLVDLDLLPRYADLLSS